MPKLSLEDISNVTFHKASFGGYKPDDVEDFIDEVEATVEELIFENNRLQKEVEVLQNQIDGFKEEEISIKTTLLEAKKIATASIKEARAKAEDIVNRAKTETENIIKSNEEKIKEQETKLNDTKKAVSEFRSNLLKIYKEHLGLIDALPQENADKGSVAPVEKNEESDDFLQDEAISIDENTSLDDVKRMLSHYPNKFILDNLDDDEIYDVDLSKVDVGTDADDEIDGLDFMNETKTIKLDAIKFGEDYDLSSDKH